MSACRLYLTVCVFSLAIGCLIGLALANRMLDALYGQQEGDREKRRQIDDACDHGLTHDISVPPPWLGEDTFMLDGMAARRN